jgi:ABC-type amino acid transport substrate-binding protein
MPSMATLVLLALTLLSSGMATKGRATVDTNIKQKAHSLTKLSSLDNKIIIMALHEAKPFVFFDCSFEVAVEEWNARHPTNPEELPSIPSVPVQPPKTCKRENECPDAPGSEPFCGITVEIARDICDILNCTVRFYIASENPHHWENENTALAAMGAGPDVGGVHWADAAGGAIIISSDFTQIAHFTTPYFQTGFRMVTRRPAKEIKFFSFVQPFDPYLWLWLGVEMLVVAVILWIIESPENTLAADRESDLIEGKVAGIFDAFYWTWSTYTNFVDKAPKSGAGKIVVMCQGFFMVVILASYTANLASSLTVSAIQPPFTGWELGDSPVAPDNMRTANIAIPDGGAEQTFLTFQAAKWGQDFGNVHTFDSHEAALDSVLCGNDDLMFHDESEILYYLNTAMVDVGNGVYTSDICNVSQVVLPAGQDPRCALMLSELTTCLMFVFDVSC